MFQGNRAMNGMDEQEKGFYDDCNYFWKVNVVPRCDIASLSSILFLKKRTPQHQKHGKTTPYSNWKAAQNLEKF